MLAKSRNRRGGYVGQIFYKFGWYDRAIFYSSANPGSDCIYTEIADARRSDFIYTEIAGARRSDFIYTEIRRAGGNEFIDLE